MGGGGACRSLGGGEFRPITLETKDFELGVGEEGQDTSRHFEDIFGSILAIRAILTAFLDFRLKFFWRPKSKIGHD